MHNARWRCVWSVRLCRIDCHLRTGTRRALGCVGSAVALASCARALQPASQRVNARNRTSTENDGQAASLPSALITRVSHECSPVRCACSRAIKIPVVRCDELYAVRLAPDAAPFRCGAANRLGRRSALSSAVASVAAAAAAAAAASLAFALASLLRNFSSTHLHHHTATCLDKGQGINQSSWLE